MAGNPILLANRTITNYAMMPLLSCTRSPSYILRKPYAYYFRLKTRLGLQALIGKTELRESLRTGYLSEARLPAVSSMKAEGGIRQNNPEYTKTGANYPQ